MKAKPLFDPAAAVAHLRAADPKLAAVIDRAGPYAPARGPAKDLFEALLRAIVYQQLNGRAAEAIHGRVLAVMKKKHARLHDALALCSDDELRAAGLSRGKLAAIRDLHAKTADGTVPSEKEARALGDEALVERLTQIRGIGPWTVHMLLLFHLGRPDVMPTGDFAVRLAFKQIYGKRKDPTPAQILRHARRWQPYRSVASWYLWRHLDTPTP
ncbi:MAG TPA: hypothetical protein VIM58_11605 [Candidatus Methylacidiphilales bacterium]